MPVTECEKHGLQYWFYGISKDIEHNIQNDISMVAGDVIKITVNNGGNFFILQKYFLSRRTITQLKIEKCVLEGDEEALLFFEFIEPSLAGICTKCFEEYNNKYKIDLDLKFRHLGNM